jgi:hypothetical protein
MGKGGVWGAALALLQRGTKEKYLLHESTKSDSVPVRCQVIDDSKKRECVVHILQRVISQRADNCWCSLVALAHFCLTRKFPY